MRYLLLTLLLSGCAYPVKRTAIVHDYIFYNAQKMCKDHDGFHYVVPVQTTEAESTGRLGHDKDYPCHDIYAVRCQDQTLLFFNDGVGYCFIRESQYEETMQIVEPPKPERPQREFGRGRL